MDISKLVENYIELRDLKSEFDAQHKAKMAKLVARMEEIEGQILAHFTETGAESVRTAAGTAYKQRRTNASVADWDTLLAFIRGKELWNMLERRVAKAAVEEYRSETGELPPGVNYAAEFVVNVRR